MATSIEDLFKPKPLVEKPEEQKTPPLDVLLQTTPPPTSATPIPTPTPQPTLNPTKGLDFMPAPAILAPTPIPNILIQQSGLVARREPIPSSPLPKMPDKFDTTPLKPSRLRYITIFAGKGASKSTTALSFPGKIVALSFDYKTVEAWNAMFNCDPRITVYDAIRYMDYSSKDAALMSAEITFQYLNRILDEIKEGDSADYPDWILFDGFEEYKMISENIMRYRNNLGFSQGVEWTVWKDRRLYIKQMFIKMASMVKQGVIFCTKYEFEETKVNNIVTDNKKKPIWFDIVEEQTDILIENSSESDNATGRIRYWAHILSSKKPEFKTGLRIEITCEPGKVDIYERLTGQKKATQ